MKVPEQRGASLLLIVLILGTVSFGALSVLARGSTDGLLNANDARVAETVRAKVMGCVDEVLIQLQKSADFAPATVTTGDAVCALAVTSPTAGQRLAVLTLTDQNFTRSVHVLVTVSPFAVNEVAEP